MRLDFDKNGEVSVDDLKSSMVGLYDFLKNFDVIETTTQIKGKLYQDAITYMQNELENDASRIKGNEQELDDMDQDGSNVIKYKALTEENKKI